MNVNVTPYTAEMLTLNYSIQYYVLVLWPCPEAHEHFAKCTFLYLFGKLIHSQLAFYHTQIFTEWFVKSIRVCVVIKYSVLGRGWDQ